MRVPEPAARRRTLLLSAAVVWTLAGAFLAFRSLGWFRLFPATAVWLAPAALAAGLLKGRFVLARLAARNTRRIRELAPGKEKICLFAFQAWESYLLVAAMTVLGILLRRSSLPRQIPAFLYLAIGAGLAFGSRPYWRAARA